jgi:hypothetical protein
MRSSFDALHDETRPLHLLDEQPTPPARDHAFTGAVLGVLAVLVPLVVVVAL